MTGMKSGHKRAARGRANVAAGVTLSEAHPLGSKPVDVRGLDFLLSVAAEFGITQIVGKNENNVWLFNRGRRQGTGLANQNGTRKKGRDKAKPTTNRRGK